MRTMINIKTGQRLKVVEHIMLRNMWEYYVLEAPTNEGPVKLCLVMGYANEIGDVYIPEVLEFAMSRTKDLTEVMPAEDYRWEE